MRIKTLDDWTISQIRSGEIIRNYCDVVKELVENSIDAFSKNINIYIYDDEVKISDDGIGMEIEDLSLSIKSHTTSKFKGFDNINSLGFRGEGLYAISTISYINIQSRYKEDLLGNEINNKGEITRNICRNVGTKITVKNLFYNMQLRRVNRNKKKDFYKIISYLENLSIAYGYIFFKIYRNDKYYLSLNDNINIGGFYLEDLNTYNISGENFTMKIYLPKQYKKTKKFFSFFVNNRPVKDFRIYEVLKPHLCNKFSIKNINFLVVLLNISPSNIDVNVSVDKSYVEVLIWEQIISVINEYFIKLPNKSHFKKLKEDSCQMFYISPKVIFNYKNKYAFIYFDNEIYVIDIHAISEKVLFLELKNNKFFKQILIEPVSLYITHSNMIILEEKYEILEKWFSFSFVGNYIRIKEIPSFMNTDNLEYNFFYILNNNDAFDDLLKELACKNAIKSGDVLTEEEIIELFKKVFEDNDYSSCNHGRNTYFILQEKFLNKKFQR
ncbi:hypothetical protein AB836_02080 [Rickettsiales bacterium (ex Bugula neritina AB1)]|nr:hypothetical protein AB836_02080 [Rickettsiales bacterium (ex Bugula neritina AB1)]